MSATPDVDPTCLCLSSVRGLVTRGPGVRRYHPDIIFSERVRSLPGPGNFGHFHPR